MNEDKKLTKKKSGNVAARSSVFCELPWLMTCRGTVNFYGLNIPGIVTIPMDDISLPINVKVFQRRMFGQIVQIGEVGINILRESGS